MNDLTNIVDEYLKRSGVTLDAEIVKSVLAVLDSFTPEENTRTGYDEKVKASLQEIVEFCEQGV